MSRWNLAWLLGITAANFLALAILQSAPSQGPLRDKHENYRLMVEAVEEVQAKYVKPFDEQRTDRFFANMLNGALEQEDAHSGYMNAEEYGQFMKSSSGKFGGIGIKIDKDHGQFYVVSPIVGTPAYKAGIEAGDLILKIDGISTEGMSMKKAIELIQGDPGQKITLTVLHETGEEPVDITMKRDVILIDSVMGDQQDLVNKLEKWDFMLDKQTKIAYIRITQFTETTTADLTKAVDQLQKDGVKALILDLRGNPGGLLRAAVEVSSLFLPEGERVVSTKGRDGKGETYDAKRSGGPPLVDVPIAVLINGGSASASEIVAAALKDHGRAVIVGSRSYGKGSVQNIIPLSKGALKLTTASYWRPSGKNIHRFRDSKDKDEWGVKPDAGFEVDLTPRERAAYNKYRRERDVIHKTGTPEAEPHWMLVPWNVEVLRPEPFKDRVLEKALEYLRTKVK